MTQSYHFPDVTLLITHYNRSSSLEFLLKTCKERNYSFEEIVVSDDGSKAEHLEKLRELQAIYNFRLVTSPVNKGLANNLNKGQEAVKTPYTLYIQEDFVPFPIFGDKFNDALEIFNERHDLDIIRFYAYRRYPYLKSYKKGFSEMLITPFSLNYFKVHYYSDHPHLRRSSFLQKFGKYTEGIKGDRAEYRMGISFIQKGGKGLFYDDFQGLFDQRNSNDEPSTMTRTEWTQSANPLIAVVRYIYRQFRYNFDIHFMNTDRKFTK